MLTVNNLTANVMYILTLSDHTTIPYLHKGGRTLSFLPLAHAFGCAVDFLAPLAVGGHITLLGRIPAPKILLAAIQKVQPEVICAVPVLLEKIYRKQVIPLLEKGPLSIAMKLPLVNEVVFAQIKKKLLDSFGGNLRIFVLGGAPVNKETEAFLQKIHFPFTIGYGMTECGPLISFTPDAREFKATSCGMYLKDYLDVRIVSSDPQNVAGEILVRGENVMMGYYKNEEATSAAIDDEGWLHTGDMGTMDLDGTLYIRGRCKTMILTGSGQNIYPEEIEDKLNNMPLVLESLVLENDGKLYGLVVPDFETCEKEGISRAALEEMMKENLKNLNSQVAAYERLVSISIYPSEFEKTPKKSIKRYLYNVSKLGIN
jgi:long-chain acyl-CoA synthetase